MTEPTRFEVRPIGVVRSPVKEPRPDGWEQVEAEIVVRPELEAALDGLEGFSHVLVLFWFDRLPEAERETVLRVHPRRDERAPLRGVFATRSSVRPNPIGLTLVRLLSRRGNVLRVRGLDALDGTPVVDIKPYLPPYDSAEPIRLPDWVTEG